MIENIRPQQKSQLKCFDVSGGTGHPSAVHWTVGGDNYSGKPGQSV